MVNGEPQRRCGWCGNTIDWNTRRDAKFCANRCRQRDYRFRLKYGQQGDYRFRLKYGHLEGRPVEVRERTPFEFEGFESWELPPGFSDRQPYWGTCVESSICLKCQISLAVGAVAVVIGPGRYSDELGPFCGENCALDVVFARPPD
jgi:endogenous inhibitor of DNA gyrase (YacG/DUF329 family)